MHLARRTRHDRRSRPAPRCAAALDDRSQSPALSSSRGSPLSAPMSGQLWRRLLAACAKPVSTGAPRRKPRSSWFRSIAGLRGIVGGELHRRRSGSQGVSSRDAQRPQRGDRQSARRPDRGLGPPPMAAITAGSRSMDPTGRRTDGTATATLALARGSGRGASRHHPLAADSEALASIRDNRRVHAVLASSNDSRNR